MKKININVLKVSKLKIKFLYMFFVLKKGKIWTIPWAKNVYDDFKTPILFSMIAGWHGHRWKMGIKISYCG